MGQQWGWSLEVLGVWLQGLKKVAWELEFVNGAQNSVSYETDGGTHQVAGTVLDLWFSPFIALAITATRWGQISFAYKIEVCGPFWAVTTKKKLVEFVPHLLITSSKTSI